MALELFKKMVDVKQPFHLTLLNVCFAKFQEQHRLSATASITTFLRKGATAEGGANNNLHTGALQSSSTKREISLTKVLTMEARPEKKKNSSIDSFFAKVSPAKQVISGKTSSSNISIKRTDFNSKKRSIESSFVDGEQDTSKRQKVETARNFYSEENIDRDVFCQLSPEIQREIIEESKGKSHKPDSNDCSKVPKCEHSAEEYNNDVIIGKTASDTDGKKLCQDVTEDYVTRPQGGACVRRSSSNEEWPPDNSTITHEPKRVENNTNQSNELSGEKSCATKTVGGQLRQVWMETFPSGSTNRGEKHLPGAGTSNNNSLVRPESGFIPPDVDPKVFRELPQEIQQELIKNWKIKQEFSFSPLKKSKSTQPNKQTLYKYFKTK